MALWSCHFLCHCGWRFTIGLVIKNANTISNHRWSFQGRIKLIVSMSCHFISPSKIEMQTQQSFVCFSPGWVAGFKLILCTTRKKCAINFTCHSRAYRVCRLIEVDGSVGGLEYNRDKDIVVAPQLFFYSFLLLFHPQGWNWFAWREFSIHDTMCVMSPPPPDGDAIAKRFHLQLHRFDGDAYLLFIRLLFVILYFQRDKLHLFGNYKDQEDTNWIILSLLDWWWWW